MTDRICLHCGSVLTRKGKHGPLPSYCSARCRANAARSRIPAAELAAAKAAQRAATATRLAATVKVCPECEVAFTPKRTARQRFCGTKCSSRWSKKHESGECSVSQCDRPVRAKGECSMHYRARLRAEGRIPTTTPWTDRRRDSDQRRRALKVSASTGDPVLRDAIAKRDGFRCGLCRSRVSMTKPWPHPMSPSLDHVIPLSKGGSHDPANVQLAHLRCNIAKGARGGNEQLALIG